MSSELPTPKFDFACHRCGHCCSGAAGYVWVEEDELAGMARVLGMTLEAFRDTHLRRVRDPRDGRERLSLRERGPGPGGPCALLEGTRRCTVYEQRPRHCASFPFWPAILTEAAAFEAARAVCPGIVVQPDPEIRRRAFAQLAALYEELDRLVERAQPVCILRGTCCRFEDAGHELFATGLEADYAATLHPDAPPPAAAGRCPYHVRGRCTARAGRPLGCRTYFCDTRTSSALEEAHEHFLARLRGIERECGYPAAYARFPALLAGRGVGVEGESAKSATVSPRNQAEGLPEGQRA